MAFYYPPSQQQGLYRYTPFDLKQAGPSRLFPAVGEDGTLRVALDRLRLSLTESGMLSEPLALLFKDLDVTLQRVDTQWDRLGTLLADWEIFQSPWFNFTLPPGEPFSSAYVRERKKLGQILLAARSAAQPSRDDGLHRLTQLINPPQPSSASSPRDRFYESLESSGISRPTVCALHERDGGLSDGEFARQRLAGPNPMSLRRVRESDRTLLQSWGSEATYFVATGESVHLPDVANQNRLFLLEYPLFSSLTSTDLQPDRYVGNPQALFYQSSQGGLHPILIQLEPGNQVFTPASGADDWMRAKLYTQVADTTFHELITHLCYTHLAMEAVAVATCRQIPATHPFYQLIRPHFQFLLAINQRGNKLLLADDAAIDSLLAPNREVSLALINRAYRERPWQNYSLPHDIHQRGLEPEFLPDFPYRDDAQLLWDAISQYTRDYLNRYYPTDQAVRQDPYLQAWAAELGAPLNTRSLSEFPNLPAWVPGEVGNRSGVTLTPDDLPDYPRVPNFPNGDTPGTIASLSELVEIATLIIFTCGPQHAAVNFSQFDYLGYAPNAPMAAYARPEESAPLDRLLPPEKQDLQQVELTFALSSIRWGRLGDEQLIPFRDTGDRVILQQFRSNLETIEATIRDRNQHRQKQHGVAYPYLLPSRIPNSINI